MKFYNQQQKHSATAVRSLNLILCSSVYPRQNAFKLALPPKYNPCNDQSVSCHYRYDGNTYLDDDNYLSFETLNKQNLNISSSILKNFLSHSVPTFFRLTHERLNHTKIQQNK